MSQDLQHVVAISLGLWDAVGALLIVAIARHIWR